MGTDDRKAEEREIIQRARQGDPKAFESLVQRYRNLVYHVMYKMVQNPQEAEDLTQEAFMKAFRAIASFNEDYAFSTWLMKIATNNCIDLLRKKKLRTYSIDEPLTYRDEPVQVELPDKGPSPEHHLLDGEQRELIQKAIQMLPPLYRTVIVLRHQEERSYEEIAELLDLPVGTVKARLFRARERLNKIIKELLS